MNIFKRLLNRLRPGGSVEPEDEHEEAAFNEVELPDGMKLIFGEGSFDNFEGTQEELDEFKEQIIELFASGEAYDMAEPLDEEYHPPKKHTRQ